MPMLNLTNDECVALYILFANIGGDPEKSKRKHTCATNSKLYKAMQKHRGEIFSMNTLFEEHFYITEGNRMYWKDES